jgi:hypothetical protein
MGSIFRALPIAACVLAGCNNEPSKNHLPDAAALTGTPYTVTWGPVLVQPGVEDTQCMWVPLGNTAPIKVHQFVDQLDLISHHLIVYTDNLHTTAQPTPVACQPFSGALSTSGTIAPIAITQTSHDEITLPPGVGYTLAANQMIKLEHHYINETDSPQMAMATTTLYAADANDIQYEAGFIITGSLDVYIPAGSNAALHQFFQFPSYEDFSQSKIFAVTGHEHHLGTGVTVNVAPSPTGPMTTVYNPNPFEWASPMTQGQDPFFSVPNGGGYDFTCTWNNTTASAVLFGESATDEMCFFWQYYYPSQGSKVCINSGGASICCPEDPLCADLNLGPGSGSGSGPAPGFGSADVTSLNPGG